METWHGTGGGYTNHACRCSECRAANARHNLSMRGRTPKTHGLVSTYTVYGCRCGSCRLANTLYARDYRARNVAKGLTVTGKPRVREPYFPFDPLEQNGL